MVTLGPLPTAPASISKTRTDARRGSILSEVHGDPTMNQLKKQLTRIQSQLLIALGTLVAGTLLIWWVSLVTLDRFATEIGDRMEELETSASLGSRLEATIVDQLAAANDYLTGGGPDEADEFDRLGLQAHDLRTRYSALPTLDEGEQVRLTEIEDLHARLEVHYSLAHAVYDLGREAEASTRTAGLAPTVDQLKRLIRGISSRQAAGAIEAANAVRASAAQRQTILFLLLLGTVAFGGLLVLRTLSGINRPLRRLVGAANRFGQGDLKARVGGEGMPPEFQSLAGAFSSMADRLRLIVGETVATAEQIGASASDLSGISEEVASSSGEVSTAMVRITTGAEEQVSGLQSADVAVQQLRESATEIGDSSDQVGDRSEQIRTLADDRRRDLGDALEALLEVREVVRSSSEEVERLEGASQSITTFVETIRGIARQTNLLALNAAIEAARAGEHGRGFAVVAEEVRKLADDSASAAEEVADVVAQIRTQIEGVVGAMADGSRQVAGVEQASKQASTAFEDIIAAIDEVREAAQGTATAARENRAALETVEATIRSVGETAESHAAGAQQVSAAAQEQSAATEEMSAASAELLNAAERLRELVSGFKV